jgi:hypothetical protein
MGALNCIVITVKLFVKGCDTLHTALIVYEKES